MQVELQSKLSTLDELIKIQRDSLERGYMHGMLNGLIMAHSVFSGQSPEFTKMPKVKNKVRHYLRNQNVKK
jgi:hypothetical protein